MKTEKKQPLPKDASKNIMFKDGSFYIDSTLIINPELLPLTLYINEPAGLYAITHNDTQKKLEDNDTFLLPDTVGYEITFRTLEYETKKVARLYVKAEKGETQEEVENGLFNGMTAEQLLEWLDKRCNFNDHQKDYVHLIIIKLIKSKSLELFKEKLKKELDAKLSLSKSALSDHMMLDFINLIDSTKP